MQLYAQLMNISWSREDFLGSKNIKFIGKNICWIYRADGTGGQPCLR
jgi:hypothetical protein